MKTTDQARIFISYSHRGRGPEWKARLLKALAVFERQHLLDVWEDGKIRVSAGWNDEITDAMSSASLVVFLLTPEVLESEYILKTELPFLQNRWQQERIPIFPVVCEPCRWKEQKESQWLRVIQSPAGAEPLASFSEPVVERHLLTVATAIAKELSHTALARLASPALPIAGEGTLPPVRIYLDKFPLTRGPGLREEKLIGREQELALLDLAFAQPHTAIVSLVAWGGVGKTMLVQHWLERLQREGWFGAQRVYAWSFFSQGTREDRQVSEDMFLAHALEWFGVQCEPTLSPWDKGRLLADAVARERTLLILDGIEPLQYPPGPMGGQLRAPGVQSLLKQLARKSSALNSQPSTLNQAFCMVTTREPLTDLADFQRREGSAWGSVLRVDLGNLNDEAGAALLHHAGANRAGAAEIKADDKELLAANREVDGHALTLNLLGRFLGRAHGGDIRRRDLVKFEEADRKEQGGTTFRMLAAFERWFAKSGELGARQLAVLRMLGLFDRPACADSLAALRKPPAIEGLTTPLFTADSTVQGSDTSFRPVLEEEWNVATSFLVDFGLASFQNTAPNQSEGADCHPLIREYFATKLRASHPDSWHNAHHRLCDFFVESGDEHPDTIEGLQPLYQAVYHGCQAGMHLQSVVEDILLERISRWDLHYSTNQLGAVASDLSALACFFEQPWDQLVTGLNSQGRAWVLNGAATLLYNTGRCEEAIRPIMLSLDIEVENRSWVEAARTASNLSEIELTLGMIPEATQHAGQAVRYAEIAYAASEMQAGPQFADENRSLNAVLEGMGMENPRKTCESAMYMLMSRVSNAAHALYYSGQNDLAGRTFAHAELIQRTLQPSLPLLNLIWGTRYCDFLIAPAEQTLWARLLELPGPVGVSATTSLDAIKVRATCFFRWRASTDSLTNIAFDHLIRGKSRLCAYVFGQNTGWLKRKIADMALAGARADIHTAVDLLRRANMAQHIPTSLLDRALVSSMENAPGKAVTDLDEAWDIAQRGPMRLHLADIHLHRARLFFREKPYPWKSPQDDLAAAEKLINDCGYHRRDEELADAKRAILGS